MNIIVFKTVEAEYKLNRDNVIAVRLQNGNIEFYMSVGVFVCKGVKDAEDVFAKMHNVRSFASKGVDEYDLYNHWMDKEYRYRNQCDSIEFIPSMKNLLKLNPNNAEYSHSRGED